ncbi:hypothetical protein Pf1_01046 [Flavobacterium columnare]|nr:hypothetical protein Pf1_01046 [Flavobacterium columnare]
MCIMIRIETIPKPQNHFTINEELTHKKPLKSYFQIVLLWLFFLILDCLIKHFFHLSF